MKRRFAIAAPLCLVMALAAPPLLASGASGDETRTLGSGVASYYGAEFAGRRTASGEPYRAGDFTAAHRTARFGSHIRVRNLGNGREVIVRVNDRGPWSGGRVIDLSYAAAKVIGLHKSGTARVSLTLLDN